MSASVWYEEVDKGLLEELQNTIKIPNVKGDLVPLDRECFIVRKPEEDFKIETYPSVSIYNLDSTFDPMRYDPNQVVINKNYEDNYSVVEDPSVPFNLTYQIDFWAQYQEDMNTMIKTWLEKHFRQFNLKVIDEGGTERTCNCFKKGNIVKSDLVQNGERLFHSIISYTIWVELDSETSYNISMVSTTNIKTKFE